VRSILVVPHDPHWRSLFEEEARLLKSVFAQEAVAIHHIGSTSIPNMDAKPIIDILMEVRQIERVDAYNEKMRQLGYLPQGEGGIPGRRFFIKGSEDHRTHHVHIYAAGHPEIERHLVFRDYLRAHPQQAEAYSALKRGLAQRFPHDIDGYIAGKQPFIQRIIEQAYLWRENNRPSQD